VPVFHAAPNVLERITGMGVHRGILGCFARRPLPAVDALLEPARRILVLEGITNPTNLGVIARSAAALGMDGMLLDPDCSDPLYRRAARASMGEVYAFPYARTGRLPGAIAPLRDRQFTIAALTPAADAIDIADLAPPPTDRLAIILGAEGHGLRQPTQAAADIRVRIPMHGPVDSLNVGAATAIACYVLARLGR
jgi:tRNA G18 (ribose-2'-O)-methylase SpoU